MLIILIIGCLAAPAAALSADDPPAAVDYLTQVKPLLTRHCVGCHGAQKRESGLRVDALGYILKGGDRGAAVVPGKSGGSLLYQAVVGSEDVSEMPADGPRLSDEQIDLIKRWIDEGARGPEAELAVDDRRSSAHWAFQPIRRTGPPAVADGEWVYNGIDAFVLSRLEQAGIAPSPEADRPTLLRRLSLDLRGVPPSPQEIDDFLSDAAPGAYERLVERLLASPQFGERWGRHWLDVARYADSNGFTIDSARNIWKYRDWVISAFNHDMPFDQFTIEQLAGDLLPGAGTEQLVATGFHRNTLINQEGGTDQEQFRVDAVADRVETTGLAFLGLTVGCARCHEHKYDPISQREYYELFAIFNNCDEPILKVPGPEQTAALERLSAEIAAAEVPLAAHDAAFLAGLADWERRIAALEEGSWTTPRNPELGSVKGSVLATLDDGSVYVDFSIPPQDTFLVTLQTDLGEITAVRLEALTHESLPNKGPGRADNGNFVLNEFELLAAPKSDPAAQPQTVRIAGAVADHAQEGYAAQHAVDGNMKTGWAIGVKSGSLNADREVIFFPAEPVRFEHGARLVVKLHHQHSAPNYLLGRFRLSVSGAPADVLRVPAAIRRIAALPRDQRSAAQQTQLEDAYKQTDTTRAPLAERVAELKKRRDELEQQIPETMILRERAQPRETHIHIRGDFLRQGDRVTGDVPDVLPGLPDGVTHPTRLDFARWLVSAENPLTARVTVNRFWQGFFGTGLVRTENDFGLQGSPPTHPELLDWLASEFMRRGWSMKSLCRLIVTSAVYRQSSQMRPELLERDPANQLLARQSRVRLEAEAIRDACLAASGLLTRQIGGPSVHPPQPAGIYVLTQVQKPWPESRWPDRYRRGMYTFFWRSSPYPFLVTFDAPDANTTCTRRPRSNTPLQALTLANDRAFFEIAQGLAARILEEAPADDAGRLRYAFQICLTREPTALEQQRLTAFLEAQRASFSRDAQRAPTAVPADTTGVAPAEAAAWTAVARVLLNLDEFITRE